MNRLKGTIIAIQHSGELSQVDIACDDTMVTAYILGKPESSNLRIGNEVSLLFKESEVALAKDLKGSLSLRNRFEGVIEKIVYGDLLVEVTILFKEDKIVSIISRRACEAMKLKVGESVTALVKANEMTLMENS